MAEERHAVKESDLSSWLQFGLPVFLKEYGSYILLFLAFCLLGYQVWNYFEKKHTVAVQSAWMDYEQATAGGLSSAPDRLKQVIADHSSIGPVVVQAWLGIGNNYLLRISAGVLNMPDGSTPAPAISEDDALARAQDAFQHVLSDFPKDHFAVGAAHLGLAAVAEDRHDWDAARKQYEILTDKSGPFAGTAFADRAQDGLKSLDADRDAPRLASLAPPPPPVVTSQPDFIPGIDSSNPAGAFTLPPIGPFIPTTAPSTPATPGATPPETTPTATKLPELPIAPPAGHNVPATQSR